MDIIYAETQLIGEVLLYPMTGFYLLTVPLQQSITGITTAIIGRSLVACIQADTLLVVRINRQIANLLNRQMHLSSATHNVLGILTQPFKPDIDVEAVSFVQYNEIEALNQFVTDQQRTELYNLDQELYHEDV